MNLYFILCTYWVLSVAATYVVRHLNNKKHSYRKNFEEKKSFGKVAIEHLAIWLFMPIAMPFVLLYLLCTGIYKLYDKRKYKNRPRPVPENRRAYLRKDTVFDETNTSVSLAEYNYKHGTEFTLDQVYGKGYEASLSEEEKSSITDRNSKYGILRFEESLLDTPHTQAATILGNAMLSGDFNAFNSMLDNNVETILYRNKTIVGKNEVSEYWKGWRERFVITKEVSEFEVKHSNHCSNSCLQMKNMLVLFMIENSKIVRLILVRRHISGGYYTHHDDLIEDYPFKLDYIKRYTMPLREADEHNAPIERKHRMPCFCCGTKSEDLEWYCTRINMGIHGYPGIVSICPKCGKVVEYVTEGRYRIEEPVVDEFDMLDEYVDCWNNLTIGNLEDYLSDDFRYSSTWVLEELDKKGYLEYFAEKVRRIEETGSAIKARLEGKLLIITQGGNNVAIAVKFENGKIVRADMSPASFYGIPDKVSNSNPKFNLLGLRNFFNDCPLKGTKYVDDIPELLVKKMDYEKLRNGEDDPYSTMSLKQIAEECDWFYLGELASNDKPSLEIIKSCYSNAVKDGLYEAANNLGVLAYNYENDQEEGNKWLNHAAAKGSQNAMINQFTIHWTNEEYLEGMAMLSNMFNKKNPSLKCLWNLAYLYYMGNDCPHNTIEQDLAKAKEILSIIANYDINLICENEKIMPEKARKMLAQLDSTNVFGENGKEFHNIVTTSVIRTTDIKNKNEVFTRLTSLDLIPGYHLGLRLAEHVGSGDESNFFVFDENGKEDTNITEFITASPSAMSAWQIYLLMTSPTIMPVFWHGGYILRKFIFNEKDLNEITQLRNLDLSLLDKQNLLFPSVKKEIDQITGKVTAHVFCCYWNEWKGLVREHATVVFNGNKIEAFDKKDENVFYPYDCGICY